MWLLLEIAAAKKFIEILHSGRADSAVSFGFRNAQIPIQSDLMPPCDHTPDRFVTATMRP
jgi:hypothetical protein